MNIPPTLSFPLPLPLPSLILFLSWVSLWFLSLENVINQETGEWWVLSERRPYWLKANVWVKMEKNQTEPES